MFKKSIDRRLEPFIEAEIIGVNTPEHNKMYLAIREFVESCEVRCGEFEGHCYIIKKINRDTFMLYQEHEMPDGMFYSAEAIIVHKKALLNAIDKAALNEGISIPT